MDNAVDEKVKVQLWTLWRSGTHWLANMLAHLLNMEWCYSSEKTVTASVREKKWGVLPVKHITGPPDPGILQIEKQHIKTIFLYRDPRDVIASNVNMRKFREGYRDGLPPFPDMEISEILDWELEAYKEFYRKDLPKWVRTESAWLFKVRYEDMIKNIWDVLTDILKFIGLLLPEEKIAEAIETYEFSRVAGRTPGIEDKGAHNRKGIVGDWKNQFCQKDISKIMRFFDQEGTRELLL